MKNSKKGILEFKQSLDNSQLMSSDEKENIKGGSWAYQLGLYVGNAVLDFNDWLMGEDIP